MTMSQQEAYLSLHADYLKARDERAELIAALRYIATYDEAKAEDNHAYAVQSRYAAAQEARAVLAKVEAS